MVSQVFEPRDQTGVGSGYPFEWWAFGARGSWERGEPLLWVEEMARSQGFRGWEARWAVRFNAGLPEAVCTAVVE